MTSQSFLVEVVQERCVAFVNVCFLPTRNSWRYNNFLWMPSRKYAFRLTMFAFLWTRNVWPHNNFLLRLSKKDVARLVKFAIFSTKNRRLHNNLCVNAEQEWCLAFDNVFFMSYWNLWRHNRFLSMTTRRYVFPLAIFAFCRPEIYYVTIVPCGVRGAKMSRVRQFLPSIDQELMTSQSILV